MRNLKAIIAYNGGAYHGFQRQGNAVTVQGTLEDALSRLLNENSEAIGCGRTDAGVHARGYCFNVRTGSTIPSDGFVKGMNALLPSDISVLSCKDTDGDFNARYSAVSKEYSYMIYSGKIRNPFIDGLVYFHPYEIDAEKMSQAAELFIGEHDFSGYCKAETLELVKMKKRGAVREIYGFSVKRDGDYTELTVSGNGFLHNMVRIMAGTLVYVNRGRLTLEDVRQSLLTGERELAGETLPPYGLYLNKVDYGE